MASNYFFSKAAGVVKRIVAAIEITDHIFGTDNAPDVDAVDEPGRFNEELDEIAALSKDILDLAASNYLRPESKELLVELLKKVAMDAGGLGNLLYVHLNKDYTATAGQFHDIRRWMDRK